MFKKRFLIIFFVAVGAILVFFKLGCMAYRSFVMPDQPVEGISARGKRYLASFFSAYKTGKEQRKDGGYGFGRMLALVEACQKVKDLEHLYHTKALNEQHIETQTIRDLTKSLAQERVKFKRHIENLKERAREPLATKKMRSLTYYLHVIEECMQDLEVILTNRVVPTDGQSSRR